MLDLSDGWLLTETYTGRTCRHLSGRKVRHSPRTWCSGYFPFQDSIDFFKRFPNITLAPRPGPGAVKIRSVDFKTDVELVHFTSVGRGPDSAEIKAMPKFHDPCEEKGYDKMTTPGYWDLPERPDIPEDLLLPLGGF